MHKFTDYSFAGGQPMDLDTLEFDRMGVYEAIHALYADGATTPMIVSGSMTSSAWLFINGELLPYTAPSVPPPLISGQAYYIVVNESSSPATFEDTTVHSVLDVTRVASLTVAFVSSPPVGGILLDSFVQFQKFFGEKARGSWVTWLNTSPSGAPFSGLVQYRKNVLTNTLQLKGSIVVNSAAMSGTGSPPLLPMFWSIITGLPVDCRPATSTLFTAYFRYHLSRMQEWNGTDYIETINAELSASGNLSMGLKKNDGSVATYTVTFNTNIPLD